MLLGDDGLERRCAFSFLDGEIETSPSVVERFAPIDFVTSLNIGDRAAALARLRVERQRLLGRLLCGLLDRPI